MIPAAMTVGCATSSGPLPLSPKARLEALIDAPSGQRAPAAGFVLLQGGDVIATEAVGSASGLSASELADGFGASPFTIETPFRAASISKMAVALVCNHLVGAGQLDLDIDIRSLGISLPSGPGIDGAVLTPRALLAHVSGLKDPDAYWQAHPGTLQQLLKANAPNASSETDNWFHYCNLNYGILATALEDVSGRRFDQLIDEHVAGPLGLDAGFNWSNVSQEKRQMAAALYREDETGWQIQIDGPASRNSSAPSILMQTGAEHIPYTPGQNGALFSPQGGLRANLLDLVKLVEAAAREPILTEPVWQANSDLSNGDTDGGYYTAFGSGVQLYNETNSFWPGVALAGHHGEAYGLYAGAWHAPSLQLSFAYAVTGTPQMGPRSADHPALNGFTAPLMHAVRDAYAASAAAI